MEYQQTTKEQEGGEDRPVGAGSLPTSLPQVEREAYIPGDVIPPDEIRWKFSRSGGPGGQNVNKVETRVELVFNPGGSRVFSAFQRKQITDRLAARLDDNGDLHIVSSAYRTQGQNREDALSRLQNMLQDALRPRIIRMATRTPHAQRQARLADKRHRSAAKQARAYRENRED